MALGPYRLEWGFAGAVLAELVRMGDVGEIWLPTPNVPAAAFPAEFTFAGTREMRSARILSPGASCDA